MGAYSRVDTYLSEIILEVVDSVRCEFEGGVISCVINECELSDFAQYLYTMKPCRSKS